MTINKLESRFLDVKVGGVVSDGGYKEIEKGEREGNIIRPNAGIERSKLAI